MPAGGSGSMCWATGWCGSGCHRMAAGDRPRTGTCSPRPRRSLGSPRVEERRRPCAWSTPELCGSRSAALAGRVRFVTDRGVEVAADAGDGAVSWGDGRVRIRKRRHPEERHAGFGERAALDQTAGTKTFWNVNAKQYGPATDGMYCSVPVFLAHRPDRGVRVLPQRARVVADPLRAGLRHVGRRGRRARARLRRRPRRQSGRGARAAHRAARPDRAAAALGDRISPVALGLRLGRRAARASPPSSSAVGCRATPFTSTSTTWTTTACSRGIPSAFPIRPG